MRYGLLCFVFILVCSCTVKKGLPDLQLGQPGLKQEVKQKKLTAGVRFYQIQRGELSKNDFYTLSSGPLKGENLDSLVAALQRMPVPIRMEEPAEKDPHGNSLGITVNVGRYMSSMEADSAQKGLAKKGINLPVRHSAEDGNPTTGPFVISLLEVDLNKFKGNIKSVLAADHIQGRETVSSIAKRTNAIAAVNAGFFAWDTLVGIPGDPAGISIVNGNLVSEATNGRSLLLMDNNMPKIVRIAHNVKTKMYMSLGDTVLTINGINRGVGKALNCGNVVGNKTEFPVHDFVCKNQDEIVMFTSDYGEKADRGVGLELKIDTANTITAISNQRGGEIPINGFLIQATGKRITALEARLKKGSKISLAIAVESEEGPIPLQKGIYAVNGGPTLLRNAEMVLSDRALEGWETLFAGSEISDEYVDKKDKAVENNQGNNRNRFGFYDGWVVRRHPRTAIGIINDRKLFIAVVYGRQPGITAGASITEMSKLLKSLGAVQAFNLDGGGSSIMVINGKSTGKPSDSSGERPIGDALIITR